MTGRPTKRDPLKKFRFRVTIEGIGIGGFATCKLPTVQTAKTEYREGTDPSTPRVSPGQTKYGDLVLSRGAFSSGDGADVAFVNWVQMIHHAAAGGANDDPTFRRACTIELLNRDGTVAKKYVVKNAWPSDFDPGELDAKSDDDLIETLTLANEGWTLSAPGVTEAPGVGGSNAQTLGVDDEG